MTQTNNEREAFEKWYQSQFTGKVDFKRYSVNSIYYDNDDIETSWEAWEARAQSPISQNEQQEAVAYTDGEGDFITKEMYDEYLKLGFYTECIVPLYNSPYKQIPEGWKLLGKVSEMGVVWHKQNPHAHPVGTEFYAVLPTTSLTSETNTEVEE